MTGAYRHPRKARRTLLLLGPSLAWLLLPAAADAEPILYRFQGQGAGQIGSQPFVGSFAIELHGETDQILDTSNASQIGRSLTGPAAIELDGIGSAVFTASMNVFIAESLFVDVSHLGMGVALSGGDKAIFDLVSTELYGYRLGSQFGPVFVATPNLVNQFNGVPTDLGDLSFSSMSNVTFTATPVPEPSSLVLMLIGLTVLAGRRLSPASGRTRRGRASDSGTARSAPSAPARRRFL